MTPAAAAFREADTAPSASPAPPVPVFGPFIGLVCAVLGTLAGGWLLLAPFAFDYRAGARRLPRAALVDLSTGAAVVAIGLLAALLFAGALAGRLRPHAARDAAGPQPEPEPKPIPEPARVADPDGDLRDLLAPLVAALTADLRSRQEPGR